MTGVLIGMFMAIGCLSICMGIIRGSKDAGHACGLFICAGLCMIAAAIVYHGECQKNKPKNAQSEQQKPQA